MFDIEKWLLKCTGKSNLNISSVTLKFARYSWEMSNANCPAFSEPYGVVIEGHRIYLPWDPTAQHFALFDPHAACSIQAIQDPQALHWAISTPKTLTTGRCAPFKAHHVSKLGVSKLSRSLSVVKICEEQVIEQVGTEGFTIFFSTHRRELNIGRHQAQTHCCQPLNILATKSSTPMRSLSHDTSLWGVIPSKKKG